MSEPTPIQSATSETTPAIEGQESPPNLSRGDEFELTIRELTPRVLVTPAIIGINVVVFIMMVANGVDFMSPTVENLIAWGADFGPRTTNGEWWRLLTATFVHIGVLHLGFNMWVLADVGPLVERLVGNAGFLVLYLASGLLGSLASLYWNPLIVSAGASGAIFGICGALLGFVMLRSDSIPKERLSKLRNSIVVFLGYNLLYGLTRDGIDMAAHVGGLVAGFVGGLLISQPIKRESAAGRTVRNLVAAGAGGVAILGMVLACGESSPDLDALQKKILFEVYNPAFGKLQNGEITDAQFADLIERDVLPEWRAARQRFNAVSKTQMNSQPRLAKMKTYLELREQAFELIVQSVREQNMIKGNQSMEKWTAAEELVKQLNAEAGKGK
jgi:rhomboid protease GluP